MSGLNLQQIQDIKELEINKMHTIGLKSLS